MGLFEEEEFLIQQYVILPDFSFKNILLGFKENTL